MDTLRAHPQLPPPHPIHPEDPRLQLSSRPDSDDVLRSASPGFPSLRMRNVPPRVPPIPRCSSPRKKKKAWNIASHPSSGVTKSIFFVWPVPRVAARHHRPRLDARSLPKILLQPTSPIADPPRPPPHNAAEGTGSQSGWSESVHLNRILEVILGVEDRAWQKVAGSSNSVQQRIPRSPTRQSRSRNPVFVCPHPLAVWE